MATLLLLLTLICFSTIIISLAENINIDCGASVSYVDSDNVTWLGDNAFVTTGESLEIPGNITQPANNLRYFPSGQTNCYTNIPATGKTLVRTLFYYGNYDKKSSPPSFNVVYDRKHLDNVVITDILYISEVIFSPASENISVCLIRTSPSDVPFISSIEVYSLDAGMYEDLSPNEGLVLRQRFAYGPYGAKEIISYPSDPYGRLWLSIRSNDPKISELTTSAPSIDITGASNKPPVIVMSKALSADSFSLSDESLPLAGIPIYWALYFSEPQRLGQTQTRSFNVFLDTTQVGSGPIVPVFGEATQVVIRDVVATSRSQVVVQSTDDSILPPIINAMELYSISYGQDGGDNKGGENRGGGGGESGASNDIDSEGSGGTITRTNNAVGGGPNKVRRKKNNKLPLILGVTLPSAFAAVSSAFAAIFLRKRQHAKPQSNTLPIMSTCTYS